MKIYIHFVPKVSKAPLVLHNVASVHDAGEGKLLVKMQFSDDATTHDMVARIVVEPTKENE